MARLYFPNGDAIGHSIKFPTIENNLPLSYAAVNAAQSWLQIVGIVEDNLNSGLRKPVDLQPLCPKHFGWLTSLRFWCGPKLRLPR